MRENGPGYYYVVRSPHSDWEVWMFTGHQWYEPGESEPVDPPYWSHRVPQAPKPNDLNKGKE